MTYFGGFFVRNIQTVCTNIDSIFREKRGGKEGTLKQNSLNENNSLTKITHLTK
jgi:hypothetical protein